VTALVECFLLPARVRAYNGEKADEIATRIRVMRGAK